MIYSVNIYEVAEKDNQEDREIQVCFNNQVEKDDYITAETRHCKMERGMYMAGKVSKESFRTRRYEYAKALGYKPTKSNKSVWARPRLPVGTA